LGLRSGVRYRNNRHAFESARYTSAKIEQAKQVSAMQFQVEENKRKEEDGAEDGARFQQALPLLNAPEQPATRRGHVEALESHTKGS
jgi:hypothetical protein